MTGYAAGVDLATTPTDLFITERWDSGSGTPRITYAFPVTSPASYEVRLYMGNGWSGASSPGQRIFSAEIEGVLYPDLTDLDLTATFGHQIGGIVTHVVDVTDGTLEIEFFHGAANNPMLNGIEIISSAGTPGDIPISVAPIANQQSAEGEIVSLPVIASGGDTPASFAFSATGLPPGLQIEPTTGLIFGTVAAGAFAGSPYSVTVTVDDNDTDPSDVVNENFAWSVVDPNATVWIDKAEDEGYTGRHECSFVQAGDKFYLFGGRESPETLDTYDYASDTWATSASAPLPFNHFQATEYQGLVWVVSAFETNNFPNEDPADDVWVFDPANDTWTQGPEIPAARRRGGAGLVIYGDKFYVVGGNTIGHNGGYVAWFDEFDPKTGAWTPLSDAPRARDHFHAAVFGDKLYVIGGRLSGGAGGTFAPLIPEVDVYDFTAGTWSTLPLASDLPTPRAAASVAVFDGKIQVIGGEGNGQAYDTVEALDPTTDTWETLASLNHARHGTQAIVSGQGVYLTAGSPNQGGGNQKNMEVYDTDAASGAASSAGVLSLPSSQDIETGMSESIFLDHVGGNQGSYVSAIAITGTDAGDFGLLTPIADPFLLEIGGARELIVEYTGILPPASASLDITYDGGQTISVDLVGLPEPGAVAGLAPGLALLAVLHRRRRARADRRVAVVPLAAG
jgi:N-acetylneuraminic acid mutarotase